MAFHFALHAPHSTHSTSPLSTPLSSPLPKASYKHKDGDLQGPRTCKRLTLLTCDKDAWAKTRRQLRGWRPRVLPGRDTRQRFPTLRECFRTQKQRVLITCWTPGPHLTRKPFGGAFGKRTISTCRYASQECPSSSIGASKQLRTDDGSLRVQD